VKTDVIRSFFILALGFAGGIIAANFPLATAATLENHNDLEKKRFWVSIDEIQQNFVFVEEFVGSYSRTVTLSDGSVRTIELTPMIHKGMKVVEFKDTGGRTYMGLNGSTTNGKLMVQLRDVESMYKLLKEEGWELPEGFDD
jgi:hypothetical protein